MEFVSPVNPKNIWKLCFKDRDEMNRIFYENRPQQFYIEEMEYENQQSENLKEDN